MLRLISSSALIIALAMPTWAQAQADANSDSERPVSFLKDVRPILAKHCFPCHGPDVKQRKASLRLDTPEGAFADLGGRKAFVAGASDESEAVFRITSEDAQEKMPPGDGKRLAPEQIDVIKRWLDQGAKWETHWSFANPRRPDPPKTNNEVWVRNPIDRFVLKRLEAEKLSPSPEADKHTLIRRVCLDLIGLPPTPEMVQAFLTDSRPDAYERLVDQLLNDPGYGERWARVWLDLARFADTKGYEKDLKRNIWRYRDWVIDAFNIDMPYHQFTLEQLAGDLIPNAKPDQILATAFHRNTLTNDEGGTDDEEFRSIAVKDRVDTTMQVWMGLTYGCAKCHSHKYDPISQADYYRFYAFFNQTADADRYDDSPSRPIPSRDQQKRMDAIAVEKAKLESELATPTSELLKAMADWEKSFEGSNAWRVASIEKANASSGAKLIAKDDGVIAAPVGVGPAKETYEVTLKVPKGLSKVSALRLEAIPNEFLPKKGSGRSKDDGNFVLTSIQAAKVSQDGKRAEAKFVKAEADFSQGGYPVEHAIKNPDPKKHGWAVSPKQAEPHQAYFQLGEPIPVAETDKIIVKLDHQFEFAYPGFSLGRFRLTLTDVDQPQLRPSPPSDVVDILAIAADKRTEEQKRKLYARFTAQTPLTQAKRDQIQKLTTENQTILDSAKTPIFEELAETKRRVTKIHERGNFLTPGDVVQPEFPENFSKTTKKDYPKNRLGVAQWLMDPNNPLTARVAVNRHWAQLFGRGLVETQEDMGTQGGFPTHPELLDWLAVEFRESGWSFKKLCRLIVTSATYRQTSMVSTELAKRDPQNRLLAHGARFRLEAEMIRDNTLAISGLLSRKMHGPSVMPYQPEGIWKSTYNTDKWITSPGEDKHRRGLYTFIKRTSPYPAMISLDAPSREFCSIRRITTNTPLQALVTLNDDVYVEAAQALARTAIEKGGETARERIGFALERALIRPAQARELDRLTQLYERQLQHYQASNQTEAARLLATQPLGALPNGMNVAEAAAMTTVCNVILNLDEMLTKG